MATTTKATKATGGTRRVPLNVPAPLMRQLERLAQGTRLPVETVARICVEYGLLLYTRTLKAKGYAA